MTDLQEIDRMTLWEYRLRIKAYRLKMVDEEYRIHMQAWANRGIKAEKKNGKKTVPVYKKFKQFFDYAGRIHEVSGTKSKDKKNSSTTARRYMEFVQERRRTDGEL